jgi:hypothetical protein
MTHSTEGFTSDQLDSCDRWEDLDILEQKRQLETATGFTCPISAKDLIKAQSQGFCLSRAGLSLQRQPWMDSMRDTPKDMREGRPTVREVLFQLVPSFARVPVEERVTIQAHEHGIRVHSRNDLGTLLERKFRESTHPPETVPEVTDKATDATDGVNEAASDR